MDLFIRDTMDATFILPNQLCKPNPALKKGRPVYIIEESLFFNQFHFHKQKLVYHRASMKAYNNYLQSEGYRTIYIEAKSDLSGITDLIDSLHEEGIREIHMIDPADDWLIRRINKQTKKKSINLSMYENPLFFLSRHDVDAYEKKPSYLQANFYAKQRKSRKILIDNNDKPTGGKWSFDADNRQRYPKNAKPPAIQFPVENVFVKEAKEYVKKHYPSNPGGADGFFYPVTHDDANKWLKDFLANRFADFGKYEDAMVRSETILHHSLISPLLNAGLLLPDQVINAALLTANKNNVPISSLEGFIRQVLGWREFIRLVYEKEGRLQRTKNYWGFTRKLPESFWHGTTGIEPVDTTIKKILATGYCHHIERLMVLGNFMLLCEIDPDDVYRWFMEMFIDAYDWVMVPNVYGMSQFADGGLMCTKPYISGSNYLMKMGDFEKGPWQAVWDGLFWRFMHKHRQFFLQNPRLGMLIATFDKMPEEKKILHLHHAEKFLAEL